MGPPALPDCTVPTSGWSQVHERGLLPQLGLTLGHWGAFCKGLKKKELLVPKTELYLQMSLKEPGLSGPDVHLG